MRAWSLRAGTICVHGFSGNSPYCTYCVDRGAERKIPTQTMTSRQIDQVSLTCMIRQSVVVLGRTAGCIVVDRWRWGPVISSSRIYYINQASTAVRPVLQVHRYGRLPQAVEWSGLMRIICFPSKDVVRSCLSGQSFAAYLLLFRLARVRCMLNSLVIRHYFLTHCLLVCIYASDHLEEIYFFSIIIFPWSVFWGKKIGCSSAFGSEESSVN